MHIYIYIYTLSIVTSMITASEDMHKQQYPMFHNETCKDKNTLTRKQIKYGVGSWKLRKRTFLSRSMA